MPTGEERRAIDAEYRGKARFLVDESMGKTVTKILRDSGYNTKLRRRPLPGCLSVTLPFTLWATMGERTRAFLKRLSMFLLYLFVAYIVLLIVVRLVENRMIFFPNYPNRLEGDWHPRALAPDDVWLTSSDGTKLHAWWISNPAAKFTFLAFHGNASNIANRDATYEFLRDVPGNVLALEYRGYGHSEGKPSELGLYLDADAAYQFLIDTKRLDPKSILSFGQSLGTAVATDLAAHRRVGGLILEAPLPSASRAASKLFWFLPGMNLLVYSQFDTIGKLKKVTAPVMVVQCTHDPVLPLQFGQEVYKAAPLPKR
ncbi:MAG TPA: alpha/beta hydrolase, partial [Candidatus Methylomirabilis sp.]|nr:alpha/beta hydrolase [Candidatus Methylomirabilis sp.]